MDKQQAAGLALVLVAAVLWGTTGTAQSFAPPALSSYWIGAARLVISALFFISWIAITQIHFLSLNRLATLQWPMIIAAALTMSIYNLAFFAGIRATSVTVGTAIALGSGPIWAGILQAFWLKSYPKKSWWIAVMLAVCGLVIATLGSVQTNNAHRVTGIALCLLSGLSYALYASITKVLVTHSHAAITTTAVFTCAAIIALPAAYVLAGAAVISSADIPLLLWLGVIATGLAYLLFSYGLQFISSATGVALALAEPVAAVILAITIVGERPSITSAIGMIVVFIGLCLTIRSELSQ